MADDEPLADKEYAMWETLGEKHNGNRDEMMSDAIRRVIHLEQTLRHSCGDITELVVALQFACGENLLTVQATANVASYKMVLELKVADTDSKMSTLEGDPAAMADLVALPKQLAEGRDWFESQFDQKKP